MQELWLCEGCKSINRAVAVRCYSCGQPRPERPPVIETAAPGAVDLSRPATTLTAEEWAARSGEPHVAAGALGTLSILLLAAFFGLLSVAAMMTARSVGTSIIADGRLALATEQHEALRVIAIATALTGLAALACHSVYLAVLNLDVPWLGGANPEFSPLRAGLFWVQAIAFSIVAQLVFWIPMTFLLLSAAFGLFGLIGGIIWFAFCVRTFGDPVSWLTRPARILRDLTNSLALPGTEDGRLVNYWTGAWLLFQGIFMAVFAISIVWLIALQYTNFGARIVGGRAVATVSQDSVQEFAVALAAVTALVESIAWAATIGITMWLTVVLAERVREREALARAVRAARPLQNAGGRTD